MRYLFSMLFIIQGIVVQSQNSEDSQRIFREERERLDSLINQNAPHFVAETLNGKMFDLSDHKGKIVVINFWSLSCAYCFREIVDFNKIVKERSKENFLLISLMDNTKEELNSKITENGDFYKLNKAVFKNDLINFEIIPNAISIMKEYKLGKGFPKTFFIDENGKIKDFVTGYFVHYEGIPGQLSNFEQIDNRIKKLM